MTKVEQNRVVAWRLRIIREANELPRGVAQTCRHFGLSLAKPSINGEPDTKTTVTPACAIGREHRFIFLMPHLGLWSQRSCI